MRASFTIPKKLHTLSTEDNYPLMRTVHLTRFHLRHSQRAIIITLKVVSNLNEAVTHDLSDRNKGFLISPEIANFPYKHTDQRNKSSTRYQR